MSDYEQNKINKLKKQINNQNKLIKKLKNIVKLYAPYMNLKE